MFDTKDHEKDKQTIIKQIQEGNLVYRLDIDGNVSIHVGGKSGFHQIMQHCTDIFVLETVYARQFIVKENSLLGTVQKRCSDNYKVGDSNEEVKDFSLG